MILFRKKIPTQELADFSQNLSVMLQSGMTLDEALETLSRQTKSRTLLAVVAHAHTDVRRGTSLAHAFGKHENTLGTMFVHIVEAGETSGSLAENLSFLSTWLEHVADLQNDVRSATLYPKIVLMATFLLGGSLAVILLPRFVPLFEQLRVDLPLATTLLLSFSTFMQAYWWGVLLCVAVVYAAFRALTRVHAVRVFVHSIVLRLPFFGTLFMQYQLALISQVFSTAFKSGLDLQEALRTATSAATNTTYTQSLQRIRERIDKGTSLTVAMDDYPRLYPLNFTNIVRVGERSGTLEESFFHLTNYYTKEVRTRTKRLPTVIEPVLLIMIGIVVGLVAFAIIMPVYQLTRGFQ